MALRDWHGWHIGVMWGIGLGIAWLIGRVGVTVVSGEAAPGGGAVTGSTAPLWTTGLVLVLVTLLIIVTIRWVKGQILDD